ncbi:PREDICTED: complement C3 isoform X2 [Propithecus coquereli]|uniref:complement C3 isoform X2 n=1 Tax=Propithecus coquereli TaxID=379532 RepID=UPI00063EFFFF|nr:PREDICTED: complement C3 isoform X2 [Propithecus coquereli]
MDVCWPLGLLLLLLGNPPTCADPLYILVTPRVLRVGSPENIHIQAHSDSRQPLTGALEVNLTVWDFPMRKTLVARTHLILSPGNNFMDQTPVTVPESLINPPKVGQQYVVIRVAWAPTSDPSYMEKMVLVAPHAGYIFIQTDKPIYTPEHLVQYRVFTVNHKMDPVTRTFTLDIKNPEGVTVISQLLFAKGGFFANSFDLPELVSFGTWTIEASYPSAPKQRFKAAFDVKEYVLPSFEVQLIPNKTFFYLNDKALGVDIQARYIFNKPVDGHALAIFGVKLDSRRIPIQSSLQRVEVSAGLGHVSLQKDTLMAAFQGPQEDFIGASIFVNVTVFSSGGERVQTETSGVKIVQSPYNIKFIRTPQYFKPGMPFHFQVFVSNPDGSPASRVLVRCQNHKVYTSADGVATLTINTDGDLHQLPILVETEDSLRPEEQASARMTAWPYSTQNGSGNFLHIEVKTLGTEVGSSIQLSLNTRHRDSAAKDQITHFTILVLSKGQIVNAKHQLKSLGSVYTSAIIDVTSEMLPSFRLLAFYLLPRGVGQDPELVADSIWIDVNDRCMGTLKVGLKNDGFFQSLEPQSVVDLKVTGDAEATVGLVAVDKAVYVLSSKHKLTQKKVWDVVEEHDIGCTAGSGKDRLAVFKDAGLDLKISTGTDTLASSDWKCPQDPPPSRRRRSLKRLETKRNAVNKFKTELERKCCEAGLRESPAGLSCEERSRHVRYGPACVAAFLDCCHLSEALTREAREDQLILGTMDEGEDFDDLFLDGLPVRTLFPDSWLWRKVTLPQSGSGVSHYPISVNVPDSITTWQFVAVSLKTGQGLCVSDPFELTVMKSFFVDLKLPPSMVRNEQVQIQAVLYNFRDRQVKVRVEFPHKEPLCSASKPGAPSRQVVVVPPTSSKMVSFVLLPLEIGKVDVEVKAVGYGVQDHVKKTLSVQAGGQIQLMSHSILLDPQGQTQVELVPRQDVLNKVPGTPAEVFISVQGDILGETVVGSLLPRETQRLLRVPTGCPEQTLSSLVSAIILTQYLDSTGQWGKVGVEHRDQVMKNIVSGYTRMLTHRSPDGTYHTSKGSPGSTWLTSYVFRVFSLAYSTMTISLLDLASVCAIANWIITERQAEDGRFLEKGPVVMTSMQGGYHGSEADTSLTALVLIALHEGKELCSQKTPNLVASIHQARGFLERKLPDIQTTFAVAIVSYALALANSPRANDRLDSFASHDKSHWQVKERDLGSLYTVEATAYALLQKLTLGRYNETHAIAKWLLEKRELGGGFLSTQTTVVAIEALTRFRKAVPFEGDQDLRVQISVPKRALNVEWLIDHNNAYQQRSAKFFASDDLEIKASGSGKGTISILTVYHRSPESWEDTCNMYHLNVTLQSTPEENKKGEETFQLRMETRFQGNREATMTIMEVSLLTGFYPNQDDLKQLTSDVEMYAFQYETKTSSSDSTVVLYLEKLSHEEDTVLGFRIHRMLQAEFLQAAQVTVYDYYEPSRRCSAFYNLPTERSSLRKICHKDVCRCAEEQCLSPRKGSSRLRQEDLQAAACEAGVDFVYKVRLDSVEVSASSPYTYYTMQLQAIIKSGTDPAVPLTMKKFVSHATCHDSLGLQEQESYLIMGQTSDLWRVKSDYIYVLGKETFLMHWPSDRDMSKKELLDQLEEFSEHMHTHGCES